MEKSARDIEQDLALCEKATPGPWDKIKRRDGHLYLGTAIKPVVDVCNLYGDESKANLSFIAAAREALPYWLGEVKRLREDFINEGVDKP